MQKLIQKRNQHLPLSDRKEPLAFKNPARGSLADQGRGRASPRVAIAFPPDTFAAIQALAEHDGTSFGEQVRMLCKLALTSPHLWEKEDGGNV